MSIIAIFLNELLIYDCRPNVSVISLEKLRLKPVLRLKNRRFAGVGVTGDMSWIIGCLGDRAQNGGLAVPNNMDSNGTLNF